MHKSFYLWGIPWALIPYPNISWQLAGLAIQILGVIWLLLDRRP